MATERRRMILKNGRILDEREATVSLYDSGAMAGDAVFEMTRTFEGKTFRLPDHLARLERGVALLEHPPLPCPDIGEAHEELLEYHRHAFPDEEEWRTLIHVSRGPLPIYQHLAQEPQVIITAYPLRWVVGPGAWQYDGVEAITIGAEWGGPYAKAKHRSRLELHMAERAVRRVNGPRAVPILLRHGRDVTESSGSNVVAVCRRTLFTPGNHCLEGITLACVEELARAQGLDFRRVDHMPAEILYEADEAFLTNTPFCIVPVAKINHRPLGDNPVTKGLMDAFIATAGVDFVAQARGWA